MQLVDVVL